jgi:ABC-2 type transport system ATP-binding protein
VLGRDPFRDPAVLAHLGLCPEQDKFYEDMSGEDFVYTLTRLHGHGPEEARRRARDAMAYVGMAELGKKVIGGMSRGMRQRTKIAQAIAHEPPVLLLDEPLTGADPVARADLIGLIRDLGGRGHCVVVSSHVLHEVEAMTHNVVLIRFGRLRAAGDILRLRTMLTERPYRVRLTVDRPRTVAASLIMLPFVQTTQILGEDALEFTTHDLATASREVPAITTKLGREIRSFTSPDADLESLYRYLITRS